MRAAEVTDPGAPPAAGDRTDPVAGDGEVVVEVIAAPITPLDLLCATGTSYFGRPATPYVPGVQGVGRLDGRLVWFPTAAGMAPGDGSMAARAVARAGDVVTLPDGVDPVLVAALGLSAVAAEQALMWRGELADGEQVIVLGAGGVVGQAGIQLARAAGARRVVAAARSATARRRAQEAGADAVVALDDGDDGDGATLTERLLDAGDGPSDLVLDPLFGAPAAAAAGALRPGGRLVNLGSAAGETCPLTSSLLRSRSLRVLGYTNNELSSAQRSAAIARIAGAAAGGSLTVAHETVALDDVTPAWERQVVGGARGRIVLVP